MTATPAEEQDGAVALSVGGKAQRAATRIPPAVLSRIDGLATLLYIFEGLSGWDDQEVQTDHQQR